MAIARTAVARTAVALAGMSLVGMVLVGMVLAGACTVPGPRGAARLDAPCAAVLLVGARGSDAPIDSDEVLAIESALAAALGPVPGGSAGGDDRLQAVELGDLDRDGALDAGGYPAVAAAQAVGLDPTAVAADGDLPVAGGWNDARRIGSEELVRLLASRATECPTERLVLTGYSMGAAAVGVGLRSLPGQVTDRIDAVVLLGDPTLAPGPWLRAPGTQWPRGLLGPREPYVPPGLAARTTSWCGAGDPYCTGNVRLFALGSAVPCGPVGAEPTGGGTVDGESLWADALRDLTGSLCGRRHGDYASWAIPEAMAGAARMVRTV